MPKNRGGAQDLPFYVQTPSTQEDATKASKLPGNPIGVLSLLVGILALVVACIPGGMWIGWGLVPVALLLGVAGVRRSGRGKRAAIGGVTAGCLAVLVAACLPMLTDAKVVEVAIVAPANSDEGEDADGSSDHNEIADRGDGTNEVSHAREGSRENPGSVGQVLSNAAWELVVNEFRPNADAEVMSDSLLNEEPKEGMHYAVVNLTVIYRGDESVDVGLFDVAYVTESGNVFEVGDNYTSAPEPRFDGELYKGGTVTGNVAIEVPEEPGLIRIELGNDDLVRFIAP